jgi:hypothetical protein
MSSLVLCDHVFSSGLGETPPKLTWADPLAGRILQPDWDRLARELCLVRERYTMMRRSPEFMKLLAMSASIIGAIAAGLSIFAFENLFFVELLADRRERLVILVGVFGASFSAFASYTILNVQRRNQLRRRLRRVFIIYAQSDHEVAKEIAENLREAGIEPWLESEQISAGEVWKDAISEALNSSAMAVVVISENSLQSSAVEFELRTAISKMVADDKSTSPIIPIVLKGGKVPSSLEHIHYVDMANPDAMEFLLRSIKRAMDRILTENAR